MFKPILLTPLELQRPDSSFSAYLAVSRYTLSKLNTFKDTFLHPQECIYYNSLQFERRQLSYLLGRYTAKQAIAGYSGQKDLSQIQITSGVFQQPIVSSSVLKNIQVSIAHSDSWGAALAFPEAHPMAIDCEVVDPNKTSRLWSQITEKEKKLLQATQLNEQQNLVLLWTMKEALSKVLKTGLMTDFQVYELSTIHPKENYWQSQFQHFAQYKVLSWLFQDSAWSIVLPKKTNVDLKDFFKRQQRMWSPEQR